MNTSLALASPSTPHRSVPSPLAAVPAPDAYSAIVQRLSRASVTKHFDAYADVAWDAPHFHIDPEDPRWERAESDPLGATGWYQALPQARRARLGLALAAFQMKMGIAFESVLQRGLLELAGTLPTGSPEIRYAYHEVIEEGQHSLMFNEFVSRSGFDAPGMGWFMRWQASMVPALGRTFPELFFLHVLGGEAPIDHVQRSELRRGDAIHPLQRRIMQIHVTEEARHVCFAERYLGEHVPRLGALKMLRLRTMAPFVLAETAKLILRPPARFFQMTGIPAKVVADAYGTSATYRRLVAEGIRPIRDLCVDLRIVTPALVPLWKALGVWATDPAKKALPC
jgi:hypothetical protein